MLAFMAQIWETVRNVHAVDYAPAEQHRQAPLALTTDPTTSTPQQLQTPAESSVAVVTKVAPYLLGNGWHNEASKLQQVREPKILLHRRDAKGGCVI
ncbi:hypothetical protein ACLKA7_001925 [Drosophila subpalustris]